MLAEDGAGASASKHLRRATRNWLQPGQAPWGLGSLLDVRDPSPGMLSELLADTSTMIYTPQVPAAPTHPRDFVLWGRGRGFPPGWAAPRHPRAQTAAWRRHSSRPRHLQHDPQAMQKASAEGRQQTPLGRPGNGNKRPQTPNPLPAPSPGQIGICSARARAFVVSAGHPPRATNHGKTLQRSSRAPKKKPTRLLPAVRAARRAPRAGLGGWDKLGTPLLAPASCISSRCHPLCPQRAGFSPACQQQVLSPARSLRSNAGTESIPRQMFLRPLTPA